MTSSLPLGRPLGLAEAQRRVASPGRLSIIAHNGASLVGGAERQLIDRLQGLQQRGHQVTLCCNHDVVADFAVQRLVPAIHMPLRGDLVFGDALRFAQFLKRQRPDVVLFGTFKKIWLGGMAASRAGVTRTVAYVSLASDVGRRWKYRYAFRNWIDAVVLNAESMRDAFQASIPQLDPDRIVTIHNGVKGRPRRQAEGALRHELGIAPDQIVIGTVARLSRQKRLERLVEAVAQLPETHAIIVGDGDERAMLEQRIQQLDVVSRVHLLGAREDVPDVLGALDLFVITSDQEGMAGSMLEALQAGVPVLSTPVSGAHEALEPLVDGREPGRVTLGFDVPELVAQIRELTSDRSRLERMRSAARERADERFAFERTISEWEAVLRGGPEALRELRR